jgi:RNA polymerase sigma-70 factor (ECF subfamily)
VEGQLQNEGYESQEGALIARAQGGDLAAYEELVRRYESLAFRTAYLMCGDPAEAEDAAQEGFIRAYRALGAFQLGRPFRPWLLRIVANQAINRRKAEVRRQGLAERFGAFLRSGGASPSVEAQVVADERSDTLWQAVRQLKPEEQTVVYLRYYLELSEAELAEALQCPPGTVKSRLHRALRRLQGIVERRYPELVKGALLTQIED